MAALQIRLAGHPHGRKRYEELKAKALELMGAKVRDDVVMNTCCLRVIAWG